MASQTEVGKEETKNIDKDKENMIVEVDKNSQDDTATNEQTINQKTGIENTTKYQNESEDSEEAGFEIIGKDVLACSKEALFNREDIKLEAAEPIGPIVNVDPKNEEIAVLAETKAEERLSDNETCSIEENVADLKENDKESLDASMIDIKVIKDSEYNLNKDVLESEAQRSEELEEALTAIPDMPSSLSKEILAESHEEKEVQKIVGDIETKAEESQDESLIDITIIEEINKDNLQDTIKEAEVSFEAEVIEDNADKEVVPLDGEDVIEFTIEAGDVIPFLTVLVAFVGIIMGLVYYYNNADNDVGTDDVLEEQEEQEEETKEGEVLWF